MRKLLLIGAILSACIYYAPSLWQRYFAPIKLTELPKCSETLSPLDHVNCRAELVTKLDKLTRQTSDRALFIANNKLAFSSEADGWEVQNLTPCKDDACLEKAYYNRMMELYGQKFTLYEIINSGIFEQHPFIGSYNFNWPIIGFLGLLSLFLFICCLGLFAAARQLKDQLQSGAAPAAAPAGSQSPGSNPSPGSGANAPSDQPETDDNSPKPWHEVLQVPPDAPFAEIRKAWQSLAKIYHPDKVSHLGEAVRLEAERMMASINAAFEAAKNAHGVT